MIFSGFNFLLFVSSTLAVAIAAKQTNKINFIIFKFPIWKKIKANSKAFFNENKNFLKLFKCAILKLAPINKNTISKNYRQ